MSGPMPTRAWALSTARVPKTVVLPSTDIAEGSGSGEPGRSRRGERMVESLGIRQRLLSTARVPKSVVRPCTEGSTAPKSGGPEKGGRDWSRAGVVGGPTRRSERVEDKVENVVEI